MLRDESERTALDLACSKGHSHIVSFLVDSMRKKNTCLEVAKVLKNTPLHEVLSQGHVETMKILLSFKETDRQKLDSLGNSPLHHAVTEQCLEMVKVIFSDPHLSKSEKEEYLHLKSEGGVTPMQLAMEYYTSEDIIEFLWEQKKSYKHTFEEYQSMINWTAKEGKVKRFQELLDSSKKQFGEESIEKILRPSSGSIPFLVACEGGKLEMVKELLRFKEIDGLKLRTQENENALHLAVSNKREEVAMYILEECSLSKDEINELLCEETKDGWKPIDYALGINGTVTMAKYLWKKQSSHTLEQHIEAVWMTAFQGEGIAFLKDVLASGKTVYGDHMERILNHQTEVTSSPLTRASEMGFVNIVKVLLSFEETEIALRDSYDFTALHAAAGSGHLEIIKLLLNSFHLPRSEKMQFLSIRSGGRTAVDFARSNYHREVVEVCFHFILLLNFEMAVCLLFCTQYLENFMKE